MCLGRESNPHGRFGPRDFRTTMAFATIAVCGLDYSFTMEPGSLGVSCLVSAPSSFRRLGSRLPSALPVMVSLNLRHSTSLFSESALKLCLSPSCLPFHHQGKWVGSAKIRFFLKYSVLRGKNRWGLRRSQSGVYEKSIRKIILLILRKWLQIKQLASGGRVPPPPPLRPLQHQSPETGLPGSHQAGRCSSTQLRTAAPAAPSAPPSEPSPLRATP